VSASLNPVWLWIVLVLSICCTRACARITGLNQIPTPDIQPRGLLSINVQGENNALGDSWQLQFEVGLTPSFGVALFEGFSPNESMLNAELGLIKKGSFLLSTGMLGIENRLRPQVFLEGGYYTGKSYLIGGIQKQHPSFLGVFGIAYQAASNILFAADYVGGSDNFATAGVNIALSPTVTFNPVVYISNTTPHRFYGCGVLKWNVKVW